MAKGDPQLTPIPQHPGQPPGQYVVWPEPTTTGQGVPMPSTVPGQTDAPPGKPNVKNG
jgi:hypothetical protein